MKICLYGYTLAAKGSGARQYAVDLGNWLVHEGNRVTLVTGKWGERSVVSNGLEYDFLSSHNSPAAKAAQIDFALRSISYFRRHRKDFDLIHSLASFPQFVSLVAWVKRLTGLPVVHTLLAPCSRRASFDILDGLVCVSRGIQERVQCPHAIYIPPFVNLDRFRLSSRYELGHSGDVLIGTMGAPFHRKGIRTLVEAIPLILKQHPGVHFFLAIDLPGIQFVEETKREKAHIERFIRDHGLQERVDVLGHVDVPRFLKSLDLFVYAVQTTLGMIDIPPTLLESLAAGCGTVTTRVGGIGELVKGYHNGLLVEPKDSSRPQAYAERILELLKDRSLLKKIRENGPPSVENFESSRVGRQVIEVYQKVLERKVVSR